MDSDFETNDDHFVIKEDFNQNITDDDDDGHMIDKIDDGNINDHSNDDDDSGNNQQQSSSSTSIMSIINNNHNNWLNIDEPVIHNVVATANFNCRLELSKIAIRVRNAEYNPKRFCAVIMRIFEPRTTALLFASGKIVITGAKNERFACLSCRKFARIVQKLGNDVKLTDFKIQNVVSTVDMKFPIRLDKLSIVHSQFCTYDPDFFPALIYRMVQPRTVLLIFVSGKLLITGARNRLQIKETMEHIGPVLCSFRK